MKLLNVKNIVLGIEWHFVVDDKKVFYFPKGTSRVIYVVTQNIESSWENSVMLGLAGPFFVFIFDEASP